VIAVRRRSPLVAGSAFLLLVLAGCDAPGGTAAGNSTPMGDTAAPEAPAAVDRTHVSRAAFEERGERWPLTVESGKIGCTDEARWFEHDGTRYGLNGLASQDRGYRDLEPIWAIDEELMARLRAAGAEPDFVSRISIGTLITKAGKLCD
jgi:hypothetical protein